MNMAQTLFTTEPFKSVGALRGGFLASLTGIAFLSVALGIFLGNRTLPEGAGAIHLDTAQRIYAEYLAHGWLPAVEFSYMFRQGPSALHPIFGAMALIVAKGSVATAAALSDGFFCFLFSVLSGFVFSVFVSPKKALLGAAFASCVSLSFHWNQGFSAPIYSLVFMLGFVVLLLGSRKLRLLGPSLAAGTMLGLAICCEPREAILIGVPLFMLGLFTAYKHQVTSWPEVLWLFSSITVAVLVFAYTKETRQNDPISMIPITLLFQGLASAAYLECATPGATGFFYCFSVAQWIPFLWLVPKFSAV